MGRRKTSLVELKAISEINMTPLMDLTFILLITFMITFPLIEQGIPINLPKGEAASLDNADSRDITINDQGILFLDEQMVSTDELIGEMERTGMLAPNTTVYVRADRTIAYEHVANVMKILFDAKITRTALVTQSEQQ